MADDPMVAKLAARYLAAFDSVADHDDSLRFARNLAREAVEMCADEIERLRAENAAWRDGVADAVEPLGYDRDAACGPADLLPGLRDLHAIPPGVWRVTVHDDGTIERVAMGPSDGHWIVRSEPPLLWVDVPAAPKDGNERQWCEDDVADSYEDEPEDGAR